MTTSSRSSRATTTSGIDITTNITTNINNFGNRNFIGFINLVAGSYYAVAVPGAQIAAVNPGEDILVHSMQFNTALVDASTQSVFAEAMLTTGAINPDGTATIDLVNPLAKQTGFLGQDNDFAPFHFKFPRLLARRIRDGIADGRDSERVHGAAETHDDAVSGRERAATAHRARRRRRRERRADLRAVVPVGSTTARHSTGG